MKRFFKTWHSVLVAGGLVLVLVAWMMTGWGDHAKGPASRPSMESNDQGAPMRVRVEEFNSRPVSREIVVNGKTEPKRAVTLKAEVEGRVVSVEAPKGAFVQEGQVVVRLDERERPARLREARALVKQRLLEYEAAEKLLARKHVSETQLAQGQANLEAARARQRQIEVDLDNSSIRTPFDGILETRAVDVGDYLSRGDVVARILDEDPMLITGDVSQNELSEVVAGAPARARLVTGQEVEGRVTYVARESDAVTRTFRIEVEVPNPDGELVSGLTSEITISAPERSAHLISPAHLSLNERGRIGVKVVAAEKTVGFHEVEIVRSTADGIWVGGLPEVVRIVTVGHGFVSEGERVTPVFSQQFSLVGGGPGGHPGP